MLAVTAGLLVAVGTSGADAAAGDIGYEDQSYTGVSNTPTSDKPQSKLWFNDGLWWADMFDTTSKTWHIFRLDVQTQTWIDTGTPVDNRPQALPDTLWDGQKLYIASQWSAVSTLSSPRVSTSGRPARLYRYTYNSGSKSYTLDSGFPANINNYSSESLTIDKDSTGKIWATWTQVSGSSTSGYTSKVYVNSTQGNDATWGTPQVIPVSGSTISPDDISGVVAYGRSKIGVLWSNELDSTVYWAVHNDGAPDTSWQGSVAVRSPKVSDDHLNLKSIQSDAAGRVFAAVKTSLDELSGSKSSDAQINLLVFKPGTGSWSSTTFGTIADCHTRPQVMLDEEHSEVHVFATAPTSSGCPGSGSPGSIYEKVAPMDNPVFPSGRGTPVIRDASSEKMNNVTSSKQAVNSRTGLVVLASNDSTDRYWHAYLPLGGGGGDTQAPTAPTGLTAGTPTDTTIPLSWAASTDNVGVTGYQIYRDGGTTPVGTATTTSYTDTGLTAGTSYSYTVKAVDAAGNTSPASNTATATTTGGGGGGGGTLTFAPTDDAWIEQANPTINHGTDTRLQTDNSPVYDTLVKFNVTGTGSGTSCTSIATAKLTMTVGTSANDQSPRGSDYYATANTTWDEATVNWNNAPATTGTPVASITTSVAQNTAYTADITPLVTGNGPVTIRMKTPNSDAARYFSKEGSTTQAPKLTLTCGSGGGGGGGGDTQAPTAPTGLTAGTPTDTTIPLSWTASTDNVGVTGYQIYRDGGTTPVGTATTTSYTDTGLTAGTSYSYTVKAVDAAGNTSPASNTATATTTGGGGTLTFAPTDDAWIDKTNPTINHGTDTRLIVDGSPVNDTLVKFNVTGTGSGTSCTSIATAKLTMTVGTSANDQSSAGGNFYATANTTWDEATVNWNNAPATTGTPVASITTSVAQNTAYTVDITPLVTGNGPVTIRMKTPNSDASRYFSKEGSTTQAPKLTLTCG